MSIIQKIKDNNLFLAIYHRELNNNSHPLEEKVQSLAQKLKTPKTILPAVEGDAFIQKDNIYFIHQRLPGPVSKKQFEMARKKNQANYAQDSLASWKETDYLLCIELKYSSSPQEMEKLFSFIQKESLEDRIWLDSYSPKLLNWAKQINPEIPCSLHAPCNFGQYIFSLKPLKLIKNSHTEIITFTRAWYPGKIDMNLPQIKNELIWGGLLNEQVIQEAIQSRALGGYIRDSESPLRALMK